MLPVKPQEENNSPPGQAHSIQQTQATPGQTGGAISSTAPGAPQPWQGGPAPYPYSYPGPHPQYAPPPGEQGQQQYPPTYYYQPGHHVPPTGYYAYPYPPPQSPNGQQSWHNFQPYSPPPMQMNTPQLSDDKSNAVPSPIPLSPVPSSSSHPTSPQYAPTHPHPPTWHPAGPMAIPPYSPANTPSGPAKYAPVPVSPTRINVPTSSSTQLVEVPTNTSKTTYLDVTESKDGKEQKAEEQEGFIKRYGRPIFRLMELYSVNLGFIWLILLAVQYITLTENEFIHHLIPSPYQRTDGSTCARACYGYVDNAGDDEIKKKCTGDLKCDYSMTCYDGSGLVNRNDFPSGGGTYCIISNRPPWDKYYYDVKVRVKLDNQWDGLFMKQIPDNEYCNSTVHCQMFGYSSLVLACKIIMITLMSIECARISIYFLWDFFLTNVNRDDDLFTQESSTFCCGHPRPLEDLRGYPWLIVYFLFRPVKLYQFLTDKNIADAKPPKSYWLRLLGYALALANAFVVLFTAFTLKSSTAYVIPPIINIVKNVGVFFYDCIKKAKEDAAEYEQERSAASYRKM